MANKPQMEVYFVFMNFDSEFERLRADRSSKGEDALHEYLSNKHDHLLARLLQPNTYKKRFSLAIVDGFAAEMTQYQAEILKSAEEVRVVEKNQELA
ncbi:subtilisin-like protease SBT2.6 [Ananas comosus]|uniref:Subtilisin-like protease SBT2.6 n=1 Tax=Ananas comosus TaxID=4615 RepID=A0A6P5G425_ANACO|nr:subtilisin-like protease SBT2.6 [Ananas comosus]